MNRFSRRAILAGLGSITLVPTALLSQPAWVIAPTAAGKSVGTVLMAEPVLTGPLVIPGGKSGL